MRKMSGRFRAVCEPSPSKKRAGFDLCSESALSFFPAIASMAVRIMPKPDHISNLERRQQALEEELSKALLRYSTDDLMIVDLKRRMFYLRDEINRFLREDAGRGLKH